MGADQGQEDHCVLEVYSSKGRAWLVVPQVARDWFDCWGPVYPVEAFVWEAPQVGVVQPSPLAGEKKNVLPEPFDLLGVVLQQDQELFPEAPEVHWFQ